MNIAIPKKRWFFNYIVWGGSVATPSFMSFKNTQEAAHVVNTIVANIIKREVKHEVNTEARRVLDARLTRHYREVPKSEVLRDKV